MYKTLSISIMPLFRNIVIFFSIPFCCCASETSDSLMNLLFQGRCFEARDLYHTINKDSISPAAIVFYKYKDCYFNNDLEGARKHLNRFIDEYLTYIPIEQKFIFLNLLVDLETEARNYIELEKSYLKILDILEAPPFCNTEYSQWREVQKRTINDYIRIAKHNNHIVPQMYISTIEDNSPLTSFSYDKTGSIINCPSTLNEHNCKITIDTGLGVPCLLQQHTADSLGLKKIDFHLDSLSFNGIPTAVYATLIDSIEIANKRFYNILGVVIQESKSNKSKELPVNIILGMPVLRELDGISIDWTTQKLSFTNDNLDNLRHSDCSEMYILYNCLYSKLYLNNHTFIGMLDTGYGTSSISLNNTYFSLIENDFIIGNRSTRQVGTINFTYSSTLLSLDEVEVKMSKESKSYRVHNTEVILDSPIKLGIRDGIIGLSLYKEISQTTYFDFKNMKIIINPL